MTGTTVLIALGCWSVASVCVALIAGRVLRPSPLERAHDDLEEARSAYVAACAKRDGLAQSRTFAAYRDAMVAFDAARAA